MLRRIVLTRDSAGDSFGRIAADLTHDGVLSPTGRHFLRRVAHLMNPAPNE